MDPVYFVEKFKKKTCWIDEHVNKSSSFFILLANFTLTSKKEYFTEQKKKFRQCSKLHMVKAVEKIDQKVKKNVYSVPGWMMNDDIRTSFELDLPSWISALNVLKRMKHGCQRSVWKFFSSLAFMNDVGVFVFKMNWKWNGNVLVNTEHIWAYHVKLWNSTVKWKKIH